MKKFLIIVMAAVFSLALYQTLYYRLDYFKEPDMENVLVTAKAEGENIFLTTEKGEQVIDIKGVQISGSLPGHYPKENFADKNTYKRWFKQIHEMGANTVSVCSIMPSIFYDAVYEYNLNNSEPLYLFQGISVDDYAQNSGSDAYTPLFYDKFSEDCMDAVDIIHGEKRYSLESGSSGASGFYCRDISGWVIGFILGTEWNPDTVAYTNHTQEKKSFKGSYLYTSGDASPFETMLADIGNTVINYETSKYGVQRPISFYNSRLTDPFVYQSEESELYNKNVQIDTEHIIDDKSYKAGLFAAYAVYPNSTELLSFEQYPEKLLQGGKKLPENTDTSDLYELYLALLNAHHSVPVVVSEFGTSAARGSVNKGDNGEIKPVTEQMQGEIIVDCYNDIKQTGCAGGVICQWQDEWYKRSWNTQAYEDTFSSLNWNDCQTDSKNYGLLTFDPGNKESICITDGDTSEWSNDEPVASSADGTRLYMEYDEKYIYFRVNRKNFDYENEKIYIPIDVTPLSGSDYAENCNLKFEKAADFLIVLDGKENSRILVQEYYDPFPIVFGEVYDKKNPFYHIPEKDSPLFKRIYMPLAAEPGWSYTKQTTSFIYKKYETGKLIYGSGDHESYCYNSASDFIFSGDDTEIRIPWLLLNFSDPSQMQIHDDYYENFGIENMSIDSIYIGAASSRSEESVISMSEVKVKGWYKDISYHERLRKAYYAVQKIWTSPQIREE